jgi:hypothetical protein
MRNFLARGALYALMRSSIAALALLASITVADAQSVTTTVTVPAPGGSNDNTIICLYMNSTLAPAGTALGASQNCYGLPDATASAMIGAFQAQCRGPTPPMPCTPTQTIAYLSSSIYQSVLQIVQDYIKQLAVNAVVAPTVTPIAPASAVAPKKK